MGGDAGGAVGGGGVGAAGGWVTGVSGGGDGSGATGASGPGSSSLSRRKRRKRDIGRCEPKVPLYSAARPAAHVFRPVRLTFPMPSLPSERLRELGIALPPPPRPAGTYSPVVVDGDRAWVSGQIVTEGGKVVSPGLVEKDVPVEVARDLARRAGLQALSALAAELGSLDRVVRFLRVVVYVASSPGFGRQHEVANGATDLFVQVFGDAGRPARAAVGVAGLPLNAAVEVECLVRTGPRS